MCGAELPVTPGAQWDAGVLEPLPAPAPGAHPAPLHQPRAARCEMPGWSYGSWAAVTDFSFCCFFRVGVIGVVASPGWQHDRGAARLQ